MRIRVLFQIMFVLAVLVVLGVGAYTVITQMEQQTPNVMVDVVLTLAIVLVVGGLMIAHGVLQEYVFLGRRQLDNVEDAKLLALAARSSPVDRPKLAVNVPELAAPTSTGMPAEMLDGAYRDTTEPISVE